MRFGGGVGKLRQRPHYFEVRLVRLHWLLGLAVLAAAAPVWAGEIETAAPIQAVVHEFGDKPVLAYYTRGVGTCDTVLISGRPDPRVRLAPDQVAIIEDVSGGALRLTCGIGTAAMVVERTPAPLSAASQ